MFPRRKDKCALTPDGRHFVGWRLRVACSNIVQVWHAKLSPHEGVAARDQGAVACSR